MDDAHDAERGHRALHVDHEERGPPWVHPVHRVDARRLGGHELVARVHWESSDRALTISGELRTARSRG
jgi:hypothetical protein